MDNTDIPVAAVPDKPHCIAILWVYVELQEEKASATDNHKTVSLSQQL